MQFPRGNVLKEGGVLHMEEGEHDWKGESREPGTPREQLPEARAPVRLVGFQSHLWASFEQSTSCPSPGDGVVSGHGTAWELKELEETGRWSQQWLEKAHLHDGAE